MRYFHRERGYQEENKCEWWDTYLGLGSDSSLGGHEQRRRPREARCREERAATRCGRNRECMMRQRGNKQRPDPRDGTAQRLMHKPTRVYWRASRWIPRTSDSGRTSKPPSIYPRVRNIKKNKNKKHVLGKTENASDVMNEPHRVRRPVSLSACRAGAPLPRSTPRIPASPPCSARYSSLRRTLH